MRGAGEQWIKGGKQAVKPTRLSGHRFRSNEVRLWRRGTPFGLKTGLNFASANRPVSVLSKSGFKMEIPSHRLSTPLSSQKALTTMVSLDVVSAAADPLS